MKKLVIHIGYPRTATTSLQSGLFYELHKNDQIKYFGKSYDEEHESNYAREIFKNCIARNNFFDVEPKFTSEKTNFISIDELTFPEYFCRNYLEDKFNKSNPLAFPEKLSKLNFLNKLDKVKILVTLRNQQTVIHSHYTQLHKYFHLKNDQEVDTWEKYLRNGLDRERSILSIYYYQDVLKRYAQIFGKENIKILFFEDLVNNKKEFVQPLSNVLDIEKNIIENNFVDKKKNKTEKTTDGSYGDEIRGRSILSGLYQNRFLKQLYNKIIQNKFGKYIINKIFFRKHLVQDPTKNHQEIIFSEFRDSNLKLAEELNANRKKLKKYEYI